MIVHDPFGNDDPYKSSPAERFPRDPAPGDAVQVGFRVPAGAREAWAEVKHARPGGQTDTRRAVATRLAGDAWAVDLGAFADGAVEYVLRAVADGQAGSDVGSGAWSSAGSRAGEDPGSGPASRAADDPISAGPYRFD
ncbi:MAG TPA: hypothetical protein PKN52_02100, partial [Trueperaceae bacterium]|nr:hypothetical protein [Trueperaceae bacterium]